MKFSTKLTVFILVIVTIAGGAITNFTYKANLEILEEEIVTRLAEMAFETMDKIDRNLYERYSDIQIIATDPIISSKNSTPKQITRRLIQFRNTYKTYSSLSFFDLNRIRIADTDGNHVGVQHHMVAYWEDILKGKTSTASDIRVAEELDMPVIYFASQVKDNSGESFGVVVSRIPIIRLYEITKQVKPKSANYKDYSINLEIDLLNEAGLLLYSSDDKKGMLKDISHIWENLKIIKARSGLNCTSGFWAGWDLFNKENDLYVSAHEHGYLSFEGNNWTLVLHLPTKIAFAPAIMLRNKLIMAVCAIILISVLVTLAGSLKFTQPLRKLQDAVKKIGNGNLDTKIAISSNDEIGNLAASFNDMTEELQKTTVSRDYVSNLLASMIDSLVVINPDATISSVNKATCKLLGYNEKELIGNNINLMIGKESESIFSGTGLQKLFKGGSITNREMTYTTKTGESIPVIFSGAVLRNKGGSPVGIVGVAKDITEHKKANNALLQSEERYRQLFESSQDALMVLKPPSWKFTAGNTACIKLFKAKNLEEFTSLGPWNTSPEQQPDGNSSAESAKEMIEMAMKNGSHFFEWTHKRLGGEEFPATVLLTRIESAGELMLQATVRDITVQKRSYEANRRLAEQLKRATDAAQVALWEGLVLPGIDWKNPETTLRMSSVATEMLGYSVDEWKHNIGFWMERIHPDDLAGVMAALVAHIDEKSGGYSMDYRLKHKDGRYIWVCMEGQAEWDNDGNIFRISGAWVNITERKKMEDTLSWKLEFEKTIASISSAFAVMPDIEKAVHSALSAIGRLCGASRSYLFIFSEDRKLMTNTHEWCADGVSHQIDNLKDIPADALPWWTKNIRNGKTIHFKDISMLPKEAKAEKDILEAQGIKSLLVLPLYINRNVAGFIGFDNTVSSVEWSKDDLSALSVLSEIIGSALSRKKSAEEHDNMSRQLIQSEKLASIGEIAAGIAHEINTPLNVILGYQELMQKKIDHGSPFADYLKISIEEIELCSNLIKDFLVYARPSDPAKLKESISLFTLMGDVLRMLTIHKTRSINIKNTIDKDIPHIRGNHKQMMQVFINLINNAVQAMPAGGKIMISAKLVKSGSIEFRISDTGAGILEENINKVFTPFFTTKRPGKGTGLGLAVCARIMENHKGTLYIERKDGRGTTVIGQLPVEHTV